MEKQNFQNHSTLRTPSRTFIFYWLVLLAALVLSTLFLCQSICSTPNCLLAVLLNLIVWLHLIGYFLFRASTLKAQDRAVRAEENLRHFVLTGKLLDNRLRISQIVALRFASEEEFVALAEKAATENLSNKEIKKLIRNWKADFHRA